MIEPEILTTERAEELLRKQQALQAEAGVVLADLDLFRLLRSVGEPIQLGSSILGLMVWRDIDVSVSRHGLSIDLALDTMRPIFAHERVERIRYLNESGRFNISGQELHDRYYFAIYYLIDEGQEWKVDISFWNKTELHLEPVHESVARQLTPETRLAILWIKDVWYRLPSYRSEIYSTDIYDAVLEHGVRTPSQFDAYLLERGKPARKQSISPSLL